MKLHEKLNERIGIIKRSVGFIEKVDPGNLRRGFIRRTPDIINDFANIFLASVVIDGVTGGKSVSYLLTAALIVCSAELLTALITNINNRHGNEHDLKYTFNTEKAFGDKVLDMDYAKIEDVEVQNKFQFARQYAVYEYDAGIRGLSDYLARLFTWIFEIVLVVALSFPILFSWGVKVTDFKSFVLSGFGAVTVIIIALIKMIISSFVLSPKEDKCISDIYTDEKGNEQQRVAERYADNILYHYQNGKSIRLFGEQELIAEKISAGYAYRTTLWRKAWLLCFMLIQPFAQYIKDI